MMKLKFAFLFILMVFGLLAVTSQVPAQYQQDITNPGFSLDQEDNSTETPDDDDEEDDEEDSDDDGVPDEVESAYERDIEIEYEDDRFRSKSVLKNGSVKDKFEVEFDVQSDNAAELEFEYTKAFETNSTSNETELGYEVKFDEIIEFVDTGVPGYENETEVQVYEIGNVGWLPLEVHYNETLGFVMVNATSADGVFSLIMRLSSSFLTENNVTIVPNSLKIDVIINNFDYQGNDTKLAVKSHIKTESELSIENESEDEVEGFANNETQVGISAANATGFFSWSEIAMMDGVIVDVLSSTIADSSDEEGETSSKMYFTFNSTVAAESIVWDPKMGVVSEAAKANLVPPTPDTTPTDTTSTTDPVTSTTTDPVSTQTSETSDPSETTDSSPENPSTPADGDSLPIPFWTLLGLFVLPAMYRSRRS
ncbi:MAG: hypothetical protein ACXAE3_06145 [Candidatus Kariarchaeaceae archaeon]|jgi:hypothetical protein